MFQSFVQLRQGNDIIQGIFQGFGIERVFFLVSYCIFFFEVLFGFFFYQFVEGSGIIVFGKFGSNLGIENIFWQGVVQIVKELVVIIISMSNFFNFFILNKFEERLKVIFQFNGVDQVEFCIRNGLNQVECGLKVFFVYKFSIEVYLFQIMVGLIEIFQCLRGFNQYVRWQFV